MGKILLVLRVSTDKQELDGQKNEMIEFARTYGYGDDDIIFLEGIGASAIKLNQKYLDMVNSIEDYVINKKVEAVGVWHINRLGRNDKVLIDLKNLFIENKVQFLCKNPSMKLLDDDGSVNTGAELAYGLFATMVKQDMAEKQEKFKRTRRLYAQQGKYNGGKNIRYGYAPDENGYLQIVPEKGEIIKKIFELYGTGEYTIYTLTNELQSRGHNITLRMVTQVLESDAYAGVEQTKWYNRVYPAVISKELFDKCAEIRKRNTIVVRTGLKLTLSSRLIKCCECGGSFVSDTYVYSCCNHHGKHAKCGNTLTIKKKIIDTLLWRIAQAKHLDYLYSFNEEQEREFRDKIEVLEEKKIAVQKKINTIDDKKARVAEAYIEGLIDAETKALKLKKISEDGRVWVNELNALEEAKNRLYGLIEDIKQRDDIGAFTKALDEVDSIDGNYDLMYNIIHKYIEKVVISREWFNITEKQKKRLKKNGNGLKIDIHTIDGGHLQYMYVPNARTYSKMWVWNGTEWKSDHDD